MVARVLEKVAGARALAREGLPAAAWLTAFATGAVLATVVRTWAAGRARRQAADRPRASTHPDRRPRPPADRPRAWFLALPGNRLPGSLYAGLDALEGRRRSGWDAAGRGLAPSTEQPGPRQGSGATTRSIVQLPADARWEFEVYVNGVEQEPGVDFYLDGRDLIFDRPLRRDHVSRWPWLPGARGVGTCRQDDIVDIRYETYGEIQFKHAAAITFDDDHEHR